MSDVDDLRKRVERLERVIEAAYKAFKAPPPDEKRQPGIDSITWMPVPGRVIGALLEAGLSRAGHFANMTPKQLAVKVPALSQKQAAEVIRLVRQWESRQ